MPFLRLIRRRIALKLTLTLVGFVGISVLAAGLYLNDALGDLSACVDVTPLDENESTSSPTDTPLWDAMGRVSSRLVEGSALVPFLTVGATDARFFRRAGSTAYGFGLFSRKLSFDDYASMFHGNDERVDIESLVLSTRLWEALAQDLLG